MSRVVRSVAVGAVVGLLCVGCSDDEPRPKMAPPPSATPSVSDAPPVDPTQLQATEVLGPEETVRAWVAARNEALKNGDVEAVTALSQSQCSSCENLISPIVKTYERGGRYMTAGWSVLRTRAASGAADSSSVTAALRLAGGTTYDSANADPVAYGPERRIAVFELETRGETWVVSLIGFLR